MRVKRPQSQRDERLAHNQETFRFANRRLEELVSQLVLKREAVPFLCECADEICFGRIELTIDEYEEAHQIPDTYVVLPGHPRIDLAELVETRGRYEIVQKA